jgi:hypothetical protein
LCLRYELLFTFCLIFCLYKVKNKGLANFTAFDRIGTHYKNIPASNAIATRAGIISKGDTMSESTEKEINELLGEASGAEASYQAYLSVARAIIKEQILPYRGDPALAYRNAKNGCDTVLAKKAELRGYSPEELSALAELPKVALALAFAEGKVEKLSPQSDLKDKIARLYVVRKILLLGAEACAEEGLLPTAPIEAIKKGRGHIDAAQDCLTLSGLYRDPRYAKTLNENTPAKAERVKEAADLGTEIFERVQPADAPATQEEIDQATDDRNRLWTLLNQRYQDLWKAGAQLFGPAVYQHVPKLMSRVAEARTTPSTAS